jgi:hypothetical protein
MAYQRFKFRTQSRLIKPRDFDSTMASVNTPAMLLVVVWRRKKRYIKIDSNQSKIHYFITVANYCVTRQPRPFARV